VLVVSLLVVLDLLPVVSLLVVLVASLQASLPVLVVLDLPLVVSLQASLLVLVVLDLPLVVSLQASLLVLVASLLENPLLPPIKATTTKTPHLVVLAKAKLPALTAPLNCPAMKTAGSTNPTSTGDTSPNTSTTSEESTQALALSTPSLAVTFLEFLSLIVKVATAPLVPTETPSVTWFPKAVHPRSVDLLGLDLAPPRSVDLLGLDLAPPRTAVSLLP